MSQHRTVTARCLRNGQRVFINRRPREVYRAYWDHRGNIRFNDEQGSRYAVAPNKRFRIAA